MKNQLNHLLHITNLFGIDVDDFYTITFTKHEISFQGKMDSDKIAKHKEFFSFVLDGSFLSAEAQLDGMRVRMTLT